MARGIRKSITIPGLLAPAVKLRCAEFGHAIFTPYAVELVCYDLRSDARHSITRGRNRKRESFAHEFRALSPSDMIEARSGRYDRVFPLVSEAWSCLRASTKQEKKIRLLRTARKLEICIFALVMRFRGGCLRHDDLGDRRKLVSKRV